MRMLWVLLLLPLVACDGGLWNDPYPAADAGSSTLYTAFVERPKHLDPAQAYSENEYEFLANIYAPPLQYHYLKRPYELVPLAASALPAVRYYDKDNRPLPDDAAAERPADVEAAWAAEIERRARRALADESGGVAWDNVRRRAEAELRQR